jgi:hypothetical protein
MKQKRIKAGKEFEKSLETDEWKVKQTIPKLQWLGKGGCNMQKLINTPTSDLILNENKSKFVKYDLFNKETSMGREAKKYPLKKCNEWKLYSEPFFKVSTWDQSKKISSENYNKLIQNFYDFNFKNNTFDKVLNKITETSEGIFVQDGFIPKSEIEFRTVLLTNAWKKYNRITIQWRLKN